jgi:gluconolactonase
MIHEAIRPVFRSLIDASAPARVIGSGFQFTEGPIWHPTQDYLLFSDIPANARGRWDRAGGARIDAHPTNKGNGMTRDSRLNLIVCEHATSSVARFDQDGTRELLASHFEEKELNSPNDVIVGTDRAVYFTDPTYGRMPYYGVERRAQLGFQGVYRIPPGGGDPQLLVERAMFSQPNGLCFSPDETLLYVNDTAQTNIRVFEFQDGTLRFIRIFASGISDPNKQGVPDGMKCDAHGNIWVTAPGGLWVYEPGGDLIGKVVIPENCANLHWGGPDWRTLFVTAMTSVYALDVKIGPHIEPFMRVAA